MFAAPNTDSINTQSINTQSINTKSLNTSPDTTSGRINRLILLLTATFVAILAVAVISVSPAAAAEGPDDFLPGGDGPDEPEPPIIVFPGVLVPVAPTATVEVSCSTETATVTVGNKTKDFHSITVEVDGELHAGKTVGPNQQWTTTFAIAENENVLVEVLTNTKTILAKDAHRDCLLPDPSYDILTDCGLGKATVRLTNSGEDVANMAVQYHPNPYALQPIGPGGQLDWPLVVEPNGTVDFTIRSGHDALAVESFFFNCPVPEPKPEPKPDPEPKPEPEVEPIPEPKPEVEPTSDTTPETVPPSEGSTDTDDAADTTAAADTDEAEDASEEQLDELEITEVGSDAEIESDDAIALALTGDDGDGSDKAGMSMTKLGLIILWVAIAAMAMVAGVLAWRRRTEEAASPLAQA